MALYNGGYPATYQPYYVPQYQPQQMQQSQQIPNSNLIWVQGEAGAKSYLVAPNSTVQLWDSERQTIYLKSADASGMPSIKTLDYTIRETAQNAPLQPAQAQTDKSTAFATRAELDAVLTQIDALRAELDGFAAKRPPVKGRKEPDDA